MAGVFSLVGCWFLRGSKSVDVIKTTIPRANIGNEIKMTKNVPIGTSTR